MSNDTKITLNGIKSAIPIIVLGISLVVWSTRLEGRTNTNDSKISDVEAMVKELDTESDIQRADIIQIRGKMDVILTMLDGVEKSLVRIERQLENK